LDKLQEMPDLIGLTALLKQLTLRRFNELKEMPNLIGLIALGSTQLA
jgi:hypothetical protein